MLKTGSGKRCRDDTSQHDVSAAGAHPFLPAPGTRQGCRLGFLPLSHMYGLALLVHHALVSGVPVVVLPRFEEKSVLHAIERYKVTWALVVPPVLIILLQSVNSTDTTCRPGRLR